MKLELMLFFVALRNNVLALAAFVSHASAGGLVEAELGQLYRTFTVETRFGLFVVSCGH
jgi:hypothetical protein